MAWNGTDREKYEVIRERCASDLSDAEFALIKPHLPAPRQRGRKPADDRAILNALFYLIRCGCPWRCLPKDFPPFTTAQDRFHAWRDSGPWEQILAVFAMAVREAEGRSPAPAAAIADSQSVKTTEAGGPSAYDAGKKVKGRERHVAVGTLGLPIRCQVATADVQDRDALPDLLKAVSRKSPWIKVAFAGGGLADDETARAAFEAGGIRLTVVKPTDCAAKGFVVLPKRSVAERTLGSLNRARRLAKDYKAMIESFCAAIAHATCVFRRKPAGDSDAFQPVIPTEASQ